MPQPLPLMLERLLAPKRITARHARLAAQRPVVLMGRGKSGTRLLSLACGQLGVALGITPRLPAADIDHRPFRQAVKALAQRNFAAANAAAVNVKDQQLFEYRMEQAWRMLQRLSPGAPAWGWKWPETYLIAPIVHAAFPQGRFIHMVRDGRDLAFKRHLTDDMRRPLGRTMLTHLGLTQEPRHIQAARSWQFQVEAYLSFAEQLPAGQRMELTYEGLCRQPVETVARIADFLQLGFPPASREWVQKHIVARDLSQYRQAPPDLVKDVEGLIGGTLVKLGYTLAHTTRQSA
ncbi:MAG TPA: sulfotransferase [bacterium]